MVLSSVGDESSDGTEQRVFTVGVLIGNEADWELATAEWLARTGGEVFHAADCEFEGKHQFYRDLTQILAKSQLAGVAIALDLASHRAVFADPLTDVAYYKCFTDVLVLVTRMAARFNATDPDATTDPVRLQFTFDHRKQSEGNAGTLYSLLINEPEWTDLDILDTRIAFDGRTNPRIQMADLFTREAMKEFDRKITKSRPQPRSSWQALDATRKFRWVEYDRTYCEWLKDQQVRLRAEMGVSEDGYRQWLIDTDRVQNGVPAENMGNRYRYFEWATTKDTLGGRAKNKVPKAG